MKKIKEKEGKPWCKWCPEKTIKAVWRTSGLSLTKHACDAHVDDLKEYERKSAELDSRFTEADYQTWMKL